MNSDLLPPLAHGAHACDLSCARSRVEGIGMSDPRSSGCNVTRTVQADADASSAVQLPIHLTGSDSSGGRQAAASASGSASNNPQIPARAIASSERAASGRRVAGRSRKPRTWQLDRRLHVPRGGEGRVSAPKRAVL